LLKKLLNMEIVTRQAHNICVCVTASHLNVVSMATGLFHIKMFVHYIQQSRHFVIFFRRTIFRCVMANIGSQKNE
jgi:hypothetical protein